MSIVTFDAGTTAVSLSVPGKERCHFHSPRKRSKKRQESLPANLNLAQDQKSNVSSDIYEGHHKQLDRRAGK
ncbi:hypothetical protein CEXT_375841 [Caerostris extrusa]|uniref:Uncharacterized protein n=1 Tax=Caerostris extrusa TaxID=172846 RepID=A0AAV4U1U7_CAEEX|nr:hypothetical protein CEXT_375841 [Caerostris extrusa]